MTQTTHTNLQDLKASLDSLVRQAISSVTGLPKEESLPYLAQAKNPKFGDYQSNAMMALAKRLKTNPRELGQKVAEKIQASPEFSGLLDKVELAGPGFLNLYLSRQALSQRLSAEHLIQQRTLPEGERKTVVVDYSSPNIAKEMHVGHIRSTILGDAIARVLEHLGHRVIRQNHLGDWGTQFGMLLAYYRQFPERLKKTELANIEENYREANNLFKTDPDFEKRAKDAVVELHQHEESALALWEKIVTVSRNHLHENYQKLGINLSEDDDRGESFYNPMLGSVVSDLKENFKDTKAEVKVSTNDGAVCVFLYDKNGEPRFRNSEDEALPFLIQKSDGAYLYATTDLAAMRYRGRELKADWLIYVTDHRQALHFEMLFATASATGFDVCGLTGEAMRLQHVTFGSILGEDRKPLKTRDGGTVKLSYLLSEAVNRAEAKVAEGAAETDQAKRQIAERIGIGAVKYADLSQNRQTDYVFTWDKLLALEGNTAAYLMYAYARLSKMLREAEDEFCEADIKFEAEAERKLALALCRYPETLSGLTNEWRLNALTDQLHNTAGALMKFYDECPVLKEDDPQKRRSRLALCKLTAQVLKAGLAILGIQTVDRM